MRLGLAGRLSVAVARNQLTRAGVVPLAKRALGRTDRELGARQILLTAVR